MIGKEPQVAIGVGVVLIVVGVLGRVLTGTSSITALIPAFFGILIAISGWLAMNPARLKLMMHIVAVLALVGVLGSISVLGALGGGLSASVLSRLAMLILCGLLLYVSVMSFIAARRKRAK
ncbi:MAG: hypothetical protein AAF614_40795 [Chloroflexota bacterium]